MTFSSHRLYRVEQTLRVYLVEQVPSVRSRRRKRIELPRGASGSRTCHRRRRRLVRRRILRQPDLFHAAMIPRKKSSRLSARKHRRKHKPKRLQETNRRALRLRLVREKRMWRRADIVRRLRQLVAKAFCVEPSRVPDGKKLADLGLDSILAVELAKGISTEFKINLPAALLYDHPSVQHLSSYVAQLLSAGPVEQLDSASIFFPTHLSRHGIIHHSGSTFT